MSIRTDVELLSQVPLFHGVDPAHLQVLIFSGRRVNLGAGDTLFSAGSYESAGYFVVSGEALVSAGAKGRARQVARVGRGIFLAELAMIANIPVSSTVVAQNAMVAIKISNELFMRVCSEFPDSGAKILHALAARLETSLASFREVQDYFDNAKTFARR